MARKKILITGGAGFIGASLCRRLLDEGNDVICVDNLFTGRKENIAELFSNPYFEFIRHDIISPFMIEVDEIYNLACPASPRYYQSDPVKTIQTNVIGTLNVLELARKTKARVLQASTSEIYGDPECDIQNETYWGNVNPIGIRSCYDEGKRCAETLFFDYFREYNLEIRIARIFNTYGPFMRADDGRVVSNFITQALKSKKITIFGTGNQTRSFCYIEDLVEGLIRLMNYEKHIPTPMNLGNPQPMTMIDLAREIGDILNKTVSFEYKPLPLDDPKKRQPDISLAKSLINWTPKVGIRAGLQGTVHYFKSLM